MDKLKMESKDLVNENIDRIQEFFPGVVTESKDKKGRLIRAIDFDLLKQELSDTVVEGEKERYQLTWPGKKQAMLMANLPTTNTLRPVQEESVDWDKTENLFIEGDNLEALKILQESYLNQVKCIYIDPPYNTGKDFVYRDDFKQSRQEYLDQSGQVDEEGNRLFQNNESNGRFHSDWLSMMYPRLKLARNLLREDGVIFISIDDGEVANLRRICDEIFGEGNFLGTIVWKKKTNGNNMGYIPPVHDYFIVYSKKASDNCLLGLPLSEEYIEKKYSNPDDDPKGRWTTTDLSANHKGPYFPIKNPNTGELFYPPKGRYWVFSKEETLKRIADGRIIFGKTGNGRPIQKKYLSERTSVRRKAESWWDKHGMNQDGTEELGGLVGTKVVDHPKPSKTLKYISELSTNSNEIILDFFAGSSTTAHAVMQLNAEDKGKRKYIMVQLPEPCPPDSEAHKARYKNIAEIGKERIRRAAGKIKEETGADIDYGFRVFKVDSSNMKDVYHHPHKTTQRTLQDLITNIMEDRTAEDLLIQVMLDSGLQPSLPMEKKTVQGREVFFVAGNSLVACFDKDIPEQLIHDIAEHKPLRVVFQDKSFQDDAARINVDELFKTLSPGTEVKVI
ncbi:site-specific DNA-methyltransferase [Desulfonatronovibrio magnus]|uniref:site-specific DNA-methyltransferase n=1 Tax=Desulfonatronovibrio magnus TaxID=698827 RepID=UPI0005EAEA93|nr:site-specific DNA-methyltransferase [Desulfonatronovibrio magnus]